MCARTLFPAVVLCLSGSAIAWGDPSQGATPDAAPPETAAPDDQAEYGYRRDPESAEEAASEARASGMFAGVEFDSWVWLGYLHNDQSGEGNYWDAVISLALSKDVRAEGDDRGRGEPDPCE